MSSARDTAGALAILCPAGIAATAAVADLDAAGVAVLVIVFTGGVLTLRAGSIFLGELALRPLIRDVAASAGPPEAMAHGMSVRRKLLATVPAMVIIIASGGVIGGLSPGADVGGALPEMLAVMALTAVFAVPLAWLFAYSMLQPLDDLLAATRRLREGDFATRVPELSADEHGQLARSFNAAMDSLSAYANDNQRLLAEVHASRARIIAASDAERRRVERNIHDGAQQRPVALTLKLRMLEDLPSGDEAALREGIAAARLALGGALSDLRELARGLHPALLTTDGLLPALEQLAARTEIEVSVRADPERATPRTSRPPPTSSPAKR